MKTRLKTFSLFLSLSIAGVNHAYTQPYLPVFGADTVWMSQWLSTFADDLAGFLDFHFALPGDSVVLNDTTYHTILEYREDLGFDTTIYKATSFYVRESNDHAKLWLYNSSPVEADYLLMDLSLSEGDTFFIPPPYSHMTYVEKAIVTDVYVEDGRKIVLLDAVIRYYGGEYLLKFIEGVGPNAHMLYVQNGHAHLFGGGMTMCMYKNDQLAFIHPEAPYGNCSQIPRVISINAHPKTKARVWVEKETLNWEYPGEATPPFKWKLIDYHGKQISEGMSGQSRILYPISGLSPGIYLLWMQDYEGEVWVKKIRF